MSTLNVATAKVQNYQNQNGVPVTPALAWVNFNGTGTLSVRASNNVSSVTDNGTGDYTVNFSTAMADANYAVGGGLFFNTGYGSAMVVTSRLAGSVRVQSKDAGGGLIDAVDSNIIIFR